MAVKLEDFLQYLGYDVTDDELVNKNATRALNTAKKTVLGAVGDDVETYLPGDPRVTELVLIYADDLFSERGVSAKVSGATRRAVADMELQLRLELAEAKEAATA
jgi:hypothetical protein